MDISTSECEAPPEILVTSDNEDLMVISDMDDFLPNFTVVCNNEVENITNSDNVYNNDQLNPITCDTIGQNTNNIICISENYNESIVLGSSTEHLYENDIVIPGCTYIECPDDDDMEMIQNNCQIIEFNNDVCNSIISSEDSQIGNTDVNIHCDSLIESQNNVDIVDLELQKYVTFLVNNNEQSELIENSNVDDSESTSINITRDISSVKNITSKKRKNDKEKLNKRKNNSKKKIVMYSGATKKVAMDRYGPDVTSNYVFMKRYFCSLCNYDYSSTTKLRQHVNVNHTKNKKNVKVILKIVRLFSCEYCSKCFLGRKNLQNHISKIHDEYFVPKKRRRIRTQTGVNISNLKQSTLDNSDVTNIDTHTKRLRRKREITTKVSNLSHIDSFCDEDKVLSKPKSIKKSSTKTINPKPSLPSVNKSIDREQLVTESSENKLVNSSAKSRNLRDRHEIYSDNQSDNSQTSLSCCEKITSIPKVVVKSPPQQVAKKSYKTITNKKLMPVSTHLTQQEMLNTPQTDFFCKFCARYFRNDKMLKVHLRLFHADENSSNALPKHNVELCDLVDSVTELRYFCPVCDSKYIKLAATCRHISNNHPDDDYKVTCNRITNRSTSVYICKICKDSVRSVYNHFYERHRNIYSKGELKKILYNKNSYGKKDKDTSGQVVNRYKSGKTLNINTEIDSNNLSEFSGIVGVWKCDICSDNFRDKYSLREHKDSKHDQSVGKQSCSTVKEIESSTNQELSSNLVLNTPDLWNCLQLIPISNTDNAVFEETNHENSETISQKCINPENDIVYIENIDNSLTSAVAIKENFTEIQAMRYVCIICNAHFSCRGSIYEHICIKHSDENIPLTFKTSKFMSLNIFKCKHCSTLCVSKESHLKKCEILVKTKQRYLDNARNLYLPIASNLPLSCTYCDESETKYSKLQLAIHSMDQHLHILESKTIKLGNKLTVPKYECPYCPESYKLLELLNSHKCNVHSDIQYSSKDFILNETQIWKCQLCYEEICDTKLFNNTKLFLKHVNNCHKNVVNEIVNIHSNSEPGTMQVEKYVCCNCEWVSLRLESMYKHVQKHSHKQKYGTNKYTTEPIELKICKNCLKYFLEDSDLLNHKSDCDIEMSEINRLGALKINRKNNKALQASAMWFDKEIPVEEAYDSDLEMLSELEVKEGENIIDQKENHKECRKENKITNECARNDKNSITVENYPPKKIVQVRLVCPYCKIHLSGKFRTHQHIKKAHNTIKVIGKIESRKIQMYLCQLCSNFSKIKYFDTEDMYNEHFKDRHELENSSQHEENIPVFDVQKTVQENAELDVIDTDVSELSINSRSGVKNNNKTQDSYIHNSNENDEAANESNREENVKQQDKKNKKKATHSTCGKKESQAISLEMYSPTKIIQMRFICQSCKKNFSSYASAVEHTRSNRITNKCKNSSVLKKKMQMFKCKLCPIYSHLKYFTSVDLYKLHFKQKHETRDVDEKRKNNKEKHETREVDEKRKKKKENLERSEMQITHEPTTDQTSSEIFDFEKPYRRVVYVQENAKLDVIDTEVSELSIYSRSGVNNNKTQDSYIHNSNENGEAASDSNREENVKQQDKKNKRKATHSTGGKKESQVISLETYSPTKIIQMRFICQSCKKNFASYATAVQHTRSNRITNKCKNTGVLRKKMQMFRCKLCPIYSHIKYFTSVDLYKLHFKQKHETRDDEKRKNNKENLERSEMQITHEPTTDQTSSEIFDFEKPYRRVVYICRTCKYECSSYKNIYCHISKHHKLYTNNASSRFIRKYTDTFKCMMCISETVVLDSLYEHILKKHDQTYNSLKPEFQKVVDHCFSKLQNKYNMSRVFDNRFFCPYCDIRFSLAKKCSSHINLVHPSKDPHKFNDQKTYVYKCNCCERLIAHFSYLKVHMAEKCTKRVAVKLLKSNKRLLKYPGIKLRKTYTNSYFCSLCNTHFRSKATFNSSSHRKTHNGKLDKFIVQKKMMFICNLCNYRSKTQYYEDRKLYALHLMFRHKLFIDERYLEENEVNTTTTLTTLESTFEAKEQENVNNMNTQSTKSSQEKEEARDLELNCELCDQKFYNKNVLSEHIIEIHINCTESSVMKVITSVKSHEKEEARDLELNCELCDQKFCNKNDMGEHIIQAHINCTESTVVKEITSVKSQEKEEAKDLELNCELCDQKFNNKNSLSEHIIELHINCTESSVVKEITKVKYRRKKKIKKPIVVLQRLPSILSRNCTTDASKAINLMERIDQKDKRYRCKICCRRFINYSPLVKHIKLRHSNDKRKLKRCKLCLECVDLSRHQCNELDNIYFADKNIFSHSLKNTDGIQINEHRQQRDGVTLPMRKKVRAYLCPECKKAYVKVTGVKIHFHNKHKNISFNPKVERKIMSMGKCKLCPRYFFFRTNLMHHELDHHKNKNVPQNNLIPCKECNESFGSDYTLKTHIFWAHTIDKLKANIKGPSDSKLLCEICSQFFISVTTLEQHMKRSHKDTTDKTEKRKMKENNIKAKKNSNYKLQNEELHSDAREKENKNLLSNNDDKIKMLNVSTVTNSHHTDHNYSRTDIIVEHHVKCAHKVTTDEKEKRKEENIYFKKNSNCKLQNKELLPALEEENKKLPSKNDNKIKLLNMSTHTNSQHSDIYLTDHNYSRNDESQNQIDITLHEQIKNYPSECVIKGTPIINTLEINPIVNSSDTLVSDMIKENLPFSNKTLTSAGGHEIHVNKKAGIASNTMYKNSIKSNDQTNKTSNSSLVSKLISKLVEGEPLLCDYCQVQFTFFANYVKHINSHLKGLNKAPIEVVVPHDLKLKLAAKKRIERESILRRYACVLCDVRFRTRTERKYHYNNCHNVFFCTKCNEFIELPMREFHRDLHREKKEKTSQEKPTQEKPTICKPYDPNMFYCDTCSDTNRPFKRKIYVKMHIMRQHFPKKLPNINDCQCIICYKILSHKGSLKRHILLCHKHLFLQIKH